MRVNNELSISGTVTFKSKCKNRWQTIYSSMLYGTFFQIYAKTDFDENTNELKVVEFKLENYKGATNLGIVSAKFVESKEKVLVYDPPQGDKIIRVLSFYIEIKAGENNRYYKIEPKYTIPTSDKDSIYIEIDRKLIPLATKVSYGTAALFDTEFYYRDGTRLPHEFAGEHLEFRTGARLNPQVNEKNRPINDKGELIDLLGRRVDESGILLNQNGSQVIENGKPKFGEFNQGAKSPGAVCPKGYSKIIF